MAKLAFICIRSKLFGKKVSQTLPEKYTCSEKLLCRSFETSLQNFANFSAELCELLCRSDSSTPVNFANLIGMQVLLSLNDNLATIHYIQSFRGMADLASAQVKTFTIRRFAVYYLVNSCWGFVSKRSSKIFGADRLAKDIDADVIVTLLANAPLVVAAASCE